MNYENRNDREADFFYTATLLFLPVQDAAIRERVPAPEARAARIPQDMGAELRERRELIALKHQLKAAVRDEDYEKAIELRDRIKTMEGN